MTMTEKPAAPARKRTRASKSTAPRRPRATKPAAPTARAALQRLPSHGEISDRAYFIHLEEGGCDELENWLRAERELTVA
jgi:Protein of unknown function (DUF2934)